MGGPGGHTQHLLGLAAPCGTDPVPCCYGRTCISLQVYVAEDKLTYGWGAVFVKGIFANWWVHGLGARNLHQQHYHALTMPSCS